MGIEVLLLFAVIPCAILVTYAEEGCFKVSSYIANCGFMLLLYACAFGGVAVISLIGGETAKLLSPRSSALISFLGSGMKKLATGM